MSDVGGKKMPGSTVSEIIGPPRKIDWSRFFGPQTPSDDSSSGSKLPAQFPFTFS